MMDYTKGYTNMAQQMTDFYKSSMDNSINAMMMIQANTEKMVRLSLEQSPWFPEEGKKLINDGMKAYKKGYDDLKVAAGEQSEKLAEFVDVKIKAASAAKDDIKVAADKQEKKLEAFGNLQKKAD